MKKTLVAIAALAATGAFAQSSVTIGGNLDQTYFNQSSVRDIAHNANSTSTLNISGAEDMGAGLKASFNLVSELNLMKGQTGSTSTGTTTGADGQATDLFSRGANIGLESATFGKLTVGRQTDNWFATQGAFNTSGSNSFGSAQLTAVASGYDLSKINGTNVGTTTGMTSYAAPTQAALGAANNSETGSSPFVFQSGVGYSSPAFKGFQANYMVGKHKQSATGDYATSYSLNYGNGPLKAAYAKSALKDKSGTDAYIQTVIGASYKIGQFNLIGLHNKTTFGGVAAAAKDITINSLGVNYELNAKIDANISTSTIKDTGDNKATLTGVVARYKFSKRTMTYAGYGRASSQGTNMNIGSIYGAAGLPGVNSAANSAMVGIRHTF